MFVAAVGVMGTLTGALAGTPSFQGLGDLTGGSYYSEAYRVSADGRVVVGMSQSGSGQEAFRWENGVMSGLGDLPGGGFESVAGGVSADGSVVVGTGVSGLGYEAFIWQGGVMSGLGHLPGTPGGTNTTAGAVSADGSVVTGCARLNISTMRAFRWEAGTMTGYQCGTYTISYGGDVSSDGLVFVGTGNNNSTVPEEAYRWSNGVMSSLGDLPGGVLSSTAYGVSPEGSVVVGVGNTASGYQAFRWEAGVMSGLGHLSGGTVSYGKDTSRNGLVVVGYDTVGSTNIAFIWDAQHGMRNLKDVLVNTYGLNLTGWTLSQARCISDDGLTIVGVGTNPSGQTEGWKAHIGNGLTLTISAHPEWGTVTVVPNLPYYEANAVVTLHADPIEGKYWGGWEGDAPAGHEFDNPLTLTMDTDKNVSTAFKCGVGAGPMLPLLAAFGLFALRRRRQ
jgi:MYXO-CTERM domain-containing protein